MSIVAQEELQSIRNYLNRNFSGWLPPDIQRNSSRACDRKALPTMRFCGGLSLLYEKGLLEIGLAPEVHFEGASNLVGLDLHLTREKMRDLFRALEEKKKVFAACWTSFWSNRGGEFAVRVGLARRRIPRWAIFRSSGSRSIYLADFPAKSRLWDRCE